MLNKPFEEPTPILDLPLDHFQLGRLSPDPDECYELILQTFHNCINYLETLLKPVDPSYHCIAFRAGGYGLHPRLSLIIRAMKKTGLVIDSSIVPGLFSMNAIDKIDFRNTPPEFNYWLAEADTIQMAEEGSGVFEIPIASKIVSPARHFCLLNIRNGPQKDQK
jgi:hypothetical protein